MLLMVLQQRLDPLEVDTDELWRVTQGGERFLYRSVTGAHVAGFAQGEASPAIPVAARVPPDGSPRAKGNAPTQMVPLLLAMVSIVLIRATSPVNPEQGGPTGD